MTDAQLVARSLFPDLDTRRTFAEASFSDAHKVLLELQVAGEIDITAGKPVPPRPR